MSATNFARCPLCLVVFEVDSSRYMRATFSGGRVCGRCEQELLDNSHEEQSRKTKP